MPNPFAERYRQMPEARLLRLALREASGLTEDAVQALLSELDARGADPVFEKAVAAQRRTLTQPDVDLLVEAIRKRPCPECGQTDRPLNGGVVADAKSFILFTTFTRETVIACPDCLAAQARWAALVTAVIGWWGFPFGPIHSIEALAGDLRTIRQRTRDEPSKALRLFVLKAPGVATALALGSTSVRARSPT